MDNLDKAFELMERISDMDFEIIRKKSELDFMLVALRRDLLSVDADFAQDKYEEMTVILDERNKLADELHAMEW